MLSEMQPDNWIFSPRNGDLNHCLIQADGQIPPISRPARRLELFIRILPRLSANFIDNLPLSVS